MGFIDKIKNALGIGGVKAKLLIPLEIAKDSGVVNGKIIFTSKSDKLVKDYSVELKEEYKVGRGDEQTTKHYELGKITVSQGFSIKAGETKELDFSLPFKLLKSENDLNKEKGGVIGGLGKVGSFLDAEKSKYTVEFSGSVEGALLGPTYVQVIKIK